VSLAANFRQRPQTPKSSGASDHRPRRPEGHRFRPSPRPLRTSVRILNPGR